MGRRTGILESGRVLYLPLGSIRPNPAQPRRIFDPAGLQELADSIRQYGILQPLTVRRKENGYELIAGERRLRAAGMDGLTQAPCVVAAVDEEASGMLALVENLQRQDLDFIEEAEGLARLMKTWGLSQEQAARKVGKSQSAVANKLRLLKLPPEVLAALRSHGLGERHARALLKLHDAQTQLRVVEQIAQGGWTVARTEAYIDTLTQPPAPPKRTMSGFCLRDMRVFFNSVNHQLDLIRSAGVDAQSQRQETEREIVLTIRIPKREHAAR